MILNKYIFNAKANLSPKVKFYKDSLGQSSLDLSLILNVVSKLVTIDIEKIIEQDKKGNFTDNLKLILTLMADAHLLLLFAEARKIEDIPSHLAELAFCNEKVIDSKEFLPAKQGQYFLGINIKSFVNIIFYILASNNSGFFFRVIYSRKTIYAEINWLINNFRFSLFRIYIFLFNSIYVSLSLSIKEKIAACYSFSINVNKILKILFGYVRLIRMISSMIDLIFFFQAILGDFSFGLSLKFSSFSVRIYVNKIKGLCFSIKVDHKQKLL